LARWLSDYGASKEPALPSHDLTPTEEAGWRGAVLEAHRELLRRDEEDQLFLRELQAKLSDFTRGNGDAENRADSPCASPGNPRFQYQQLLRRIREGVEKVTPPGASILVASKGDDDLLRLPGRTAGHFPQDKAGKYTGSHPADDADAIRRLEALRAGGAGYFLLPNTAFWWLDHYKGLCQHLDTRYQRAWADDSFILFDLADGR
jgi:hypothetical protein